MDAVVAVAVLWHVVAVAVLWHVVAVAVRWHVVAVVLSAQSVEVSRLSCGCCPVRSCRLSGVVHVFFLGLDLLHQVSSSFLALLPEQVMPSELVLSHT